MRRNHFLHIGVLSLLTAGLAEASIDHSVTPKLNEFTGAAIQGLPISVPEFRGLEPELELRYQSGSLNGWLGMGWELNGVSAIEHRSWRGGLPVYDPAWSRYFVDGEELIACTALGGTHCTQRQSYLRFRFDSIVNTWTVTAKDGTETLYSPVFQTNRGTFRWLPTSATDTRGNSVSYTWWCDGTPSVECYLDTIAYNGTVVTFYRETRPDAVRFVTGDEAAYGQTRYRLKTIDVKVNGSRLRSYRLGYQASGATSKSMLASVQVYGKDAVVGVTGTVSGGTSLPATTFGYAPSGAGGLFATPVSWSRAADYSGYSAHSGDFNGDGKADLLLNKNAATAWSVSVALSNGDGTFSAPVTRSQIGSFASPWKLGVGDFNGDGKSDIALSKLDATGWRLVVALSNGDGSFASSLSYLPLAAGDYTGYQADFGDRYGEGRIDFWAWKASATEHVIERALSESTGGVFSVAAPELYSSSTGSYAGCQTRIGDYSGRGAQSGWSRGCGWDWNVWSKHRADVNQDGGEESLYISLSSAGWSTRAYVFAACVVDPNSTTCSGRNLGPIAWSTAGNYAGWGRAIGDFDGDKSTDMVAYTANTTQLLAKVALSKGDATFVAPTSYASFGNYAGWQVLAADFTGDGKDDLAWVSLGASLQVRVAESVTGVPGRLVSIHNGYGGSITLTYRPSSAWPNADVPVGHVFATVSSVTADDGRGTAITRSYEYQGARWSNDYRRHLGFRYMKSIDATGAYSETYFTQHVADPPDTVETRYHRDASGFPLAMEANGFARGGSGWSGSPFISFRWVAWQYQCDPISATCKRSVETAGYDSYGNQTGRYEYGDYDAAGDERSTITSLYANTTNYVVGLAGEISVRAGIGTSGTTLAATRIYYDGSVSHTSPPGAGDPTRRTAWKSGLEYVTSQASTYDVYGNPITVEDALGNRTETVYDPVHHLFPVEVRNALYPSDARQKKLLSWETACGTMTSVTDENGQVTAASRDALCRLTQVSHPDGGAAFFSYHDVGNPNGQYVKTSVRDGSIDNLWSRKYIDGLGRTYKTLTEPDIAQELVFDDRGLVWKKSAPHYEGSAPNYRAFVYDALGRNTRVTSADGTRRDTVYGAWTVQSSDELGKTIVRESDGYGQLFRTVEHVGVTPNATIMDRDLMGRIARITDALGNATTMTYDNLGRKTAMNDPDLGSWHYTYNDAGRLVSQTDAKGQTIDLLYDALGRLTARKNGTTALATLTYDQARAGYFNVGHVTTMVDASTSGAGTTYDFSAGGRPARVIKNVQGVQYPISAAYDVAGRLRDLTYPGAETITYGYDATGRAVSAGSYVTSATYNASGQPLAVTLGNGVREERSYDANRSWLTRQVTKKGTAILDDVAYSWNARGEITSKTNELDARDSWSYDYDDLGRLTRAVNLGETAWTEDFAYDAIGRFTSQTSVGSYVYPAPGQARPHAPVVAGARSYSYDANGNRTSDGIQSYSYDVENRSVSIGTESYLYDGTGARVKSGATVLVGKLQERSGAAWRNYVYFAGLRVARVDQTGTVLYYHGDQLGTTHSISSDSGTEAGHRIVSPSGRDLESTGVEDPFGLAGERQDSTGLYAMGARYMDPVAGQFITPDPSGAPDPALPQSLNRFAYANNNPVTFTDPTGFWATNDVSANGIDGDRDSWDSGNNDRDDDNDSRPLANVPIPGQKPTPPLPTAPLPSREPAPSTNYGNLYPGSNDLRLQPANNRYGVPDACNGCTVRPDDHRQTPPGPGPDPSAPDFPPLHSVRDVNKALVTLTEEVVMDQMGNFMDLQRSRMPPGYMSAVEAGLIGSLGGGGGGGGSINTELLE